jgi:pre-60S factor REI1
MSAEPKCVTCGTGFVSLELMRKHFETEFHLNNVRLRVEGKKPLTHHEFKVSFAQASDDVDGDGSAAPLFSCQLCKKSFRSVQTLQSHVKSTAHLMRKEQRIINRDSEAASMLSSTSLGSAAVGLHRRHKTHHKRAAAKDVHCDPAGAKLSAVDREADVSDVRCFFCGLASPAAEDNLVHLKEAHGFAIPLAHRCRDQAGFMAYVARKINGLMCLVCNETTKKYDSLAALRSHMIEVGHDRIVLGPEYAEFYSGALDDKDAPAEEIAGDALVVLGGQRTIVKRDAQDGLFQHKRDTQEQTESRRAIVAQTSESNAVLRRERLELMRPALTLQAKDTQRIERRYQRERLKIGLRANKLHPKGYDGEGEVN